MTAQGSNENYSFGQQPVTGFEGDAIRRLRAENAALRAEVERLRENREFECIHCGDIDSGTDHWERCEKHPARALRAENERLRAALEQVMVVIDGSDGGVKGSAADVWNLACNALRSQANIDAAAGGA